MQKCDQSHIWKKFPAIYKFNEEGFFCFFVFGTHVAEQQIIMKKGIWFRKLPQVDKAKIFQE